MSRRLLRLILLPHFSVSAYLSSLRFLRTVSSLNRPASLPACTCRPPASLLNHRHFFCTASPIPPSCFAARCSVLRHSRIDIFSHSPSSFLFFLLSRTFGLIADSIIVEKLSFQWTIFSPSIFCPIMSGGWILCCVKKHSRGCCG